MEFGPSTESSPRMRVVVTGSGACVGAIGVAGLAMSSAGTPATFGASGTGLEGFAIIALAAGLIEACVGVALWVRWYVSEKQHRSAHPA